MAKRAAARLEIRAEWARISRQAHDVPGEYSSRIKPAAPAHYSRAAAIARDSKPASPPS